MQVAGAVAQIPAWHDPLVQSLANTQVFPLPHFDTQAPEQSTSASVPSFTPLVQDGGEAAQTLEKHSPTQPVLAMHKVELQSVFATQPLPLAHPGQTPPPQFLSVSSPVVKASAHDRQMPESQRPLVQSDAELQVDPSAQVAH